MIRIVLFFLMFLKISFADLVNVPFLQIVELLSHTSGKNVIVSDSVDKTMSMFLPSYQLDNKKTNAKLLLEVLKSNGLSVKYVNNVIFVTKLKDENIKNSTIPLDNWIIPYKYLSVEDIQSFFSSVFPKVKYTILKHRIVISSTESEYISIKTLIDKLDNSFLSSLISVVVVSTKNNRIYKLGLDSKFEKYFPNFKTYLKILSSDISFTSTVEDSINFFAFINLLSKKGYTTLVTNPTIMLIDHKDSIIESTTTLPFLVSTTTTEDAKTQVQNSYDYKDVGVKLHFKNVVITKDFVSFDLEIFIQNVLEKSLTPIISNKHIKTHVTLKDKLVIIGGINSSENYEVIKNIPFIENLPLIGKFTEFRSNETNDFTFTIFFTTGIALVCAL